MLVHRELTESIIDVAMTVLNELKRGSRRKTCMRTRWSWNSARWVTLLNNNEVFPLCIASSSSARSFRISLSMVH
jgi:hypothetical protein